MINKDLDMYVKRERWQAVQAPGTGEIVFNPDEYLDAQDQFRVSEHALTEDEKGEYARIATRARRQFVERAESLSHDSQGADNALA